MSATNKAELFLSWLTELGSGTRSQVSRVIQSYFAEELAAAGDLWPDRVLGQLQDLGHLQMDWPTGRWTMSPARVHLLPGGQALALWTGSRTPRLRQRLEASGLYAKEIFPSASSDTNTHLPTTLLFEFDSLDQLRRGCAEAGVLWSEEYAQSLAMGLKPVNYDSNPVPGPELFGPPVQHFDPESFAYHPVSGTPKAPGLYRQQTFGFSKYWGRYGDLWFQTSRPVGEWLNAGKAGKSLMTWESEGNHQIGDIIVPEGLYLPSEHVDVLAACSGTLPTRLAGGRVAYPNVPKDIADAVQQSLRLKPFTKTTKELGTPNG